MYRRRRVLAATGTTLAGLLAGCNGGSTNDTSGDGGDGGDGGGGGSSRSRQRVTVEEVGEDAPTIGKAVDVDETTAVTGNRGALVLDYSDGTWEKAGQLLAETDDEESNQFGYDVAIAGDTVLVGAEGEAATVFQRDGDSWSRVTKLPSEGVADDPTHLGKTVALDGDTAAVRGDDGTLVFRRDGGSWTQETTLEGSGGGTSPHWRCPGRPWRSAIRMRPTRTAATSGGSGCSGATVAGRRSRS